MIIWHRNRRGRGGTTPRCRSRNIANNTFSEGWLQKSNEFAGLRTAPATHHAKNTANTTFSCGMLQNAGFGTIPCGGGGGGSEPRTGIIYINNCIYTYRYRYGIWCWYHKSCMKRMEICWTVCCLNSCEIQFLFVASLLNLQISVPYGMMWCSICTFYPQPCHSLHMGHSTSSPYLQVHEHHTWTSARMIKQCHLNWVCLKNEALDMSINLYTGTIQASIHTVRATMFLCRLNFRRVANFRDVADSTGGKLRSGKLFRSGHFAAALPEAHCWNPEHVGTCGMLLVVMDMGYFDLFHVCSWHVKTYCITVEWYCGCFGFDLEIDSHAAMIFISYFAVPVFSNVKSKMSLFTPNKRIHLSVLEVPSTWTSWLTLWAHFWIPYTQVFPSFLPLKDSSP